MAIFLWTILVTLVTIAYFLLKKKSKHPGTKEILGPKGLPIVGNLLDLGAFPNKQFTKWTKEYGDLYKVKLGQFDAVIISDPKMCKEIFAGDFAFTGKPKIPFLELYQDTLGLGILGSEGQTWEVHRRFLLRQLRDFGFGKSSMESLILSEVEEVIKTFKKQEGRPVGNIIKTLRIAVVNSLWTLLSSQRFSHDDPKLLALAHNTIENFNELFAKGGIVIFLQWLRFILPGFNGWSGFTGIKEMLIPNRKFFEETVRQKITNFNGEINDYIDAFINEMKTQEGKGSTFRGEVGIKQLTTELFDLFLAGNNTTATSICWSFLFFCKFPEVQKKLQKEITEITGNSRRVLITDRASMPYAVAVIDEILRHSVIVQDGVTHRSTSDKEFRGYFLKKDVLLQPNLYWIHHNPQIWGDPENFRPERFLTEEGKYKKNENLMPFQIGRRICVGESLARDSLFLYVTNLFQQFNMKFDPGMRNEPGFDLSPGFLRIPKEFSVIMEDRLKGEL